MQTIIVPTDFSPSAVSAMNYAADMAIKYRASILLFNAYQVPISMTDTAPIIISVDELKESAEKNLEQLRSNLAHITPPDLIIETRSALGDTIDELDALCRQVTPLAVVMGSTGHSAAERTIFGSTTLAAAEVIQSPVICVPRGTEFGKGIEKILLAVSFKEQADKLTQMTLHTLLTTFSAELHILEIDGEATAGDTTQSGDYTGATGSGFDALSPTYHRLEDREGASGINEFAERNNVDLVAIVPRKQKLMDILFSNDINKEVIASSHIPVASLPVSID